MHGANNIKYKSKLQITQFANFNYL